MNWIDEGGTREVLTCGGFRISVFPLTPAIVEAEIVWGESPRQVFFASFGSMTLAKEASESFIATTMNINLVLSTHESDT